MENTENKITINTTLKIEPRFLGSFEKQLRIACEVVDLRIVPDTSKLYEEDAFFRRMVKLEKKAKKDKMDYINRRNNE